MKKFLVLIFCLVCMFAVCGNSFADSDREPLFPNPENTAQEIANFVVLNGESREVQVNTMLCPSYKYYAWSVRGFYLLKIFDCDSRSTLHIDYYFTLINFQKNPKEIFAHVFIYGQLKHYKEYYFVDYDLNDNKLDMLQEFWKPAGPVLVSFSREERDMGKKAGIKEFLYSNGKILEEKRRMIFFKKTSFRDATNGEEKEVQGFYKNTLEDIYGLIKKNYVILLTN